MSAKRPVTSIVERHHFELRQETTEFNSQLTFRSHSDSEIAKLVVSQESIFPMRTGK